MLFHTEFMKLSPIEREALARAVGANIRTLTMARSTGHFRLSGKLAVALERASEGKFRREWVRPDLFS